MISAMNYWPVKGDYVGDEKHFRDCIKLNTHESSGSHLGDWKWGQKSHVQKHLVNKMVISGTFGDFINEYLRKLPIPKPLKFIWLMRNVEH